MDAREPTANNADLWTRYLHDRWRMAFDPFGLSALEPIGRAIAEVTAANVAATLAILVGPPVQRMYARNAPDVTQFVHAAAAPEEPIEIPAPYLRRRERYPVTGYTQHERSRSRELAAAGSM